MLFFLMQDKKAFFDVVDINSPAIRFCCNNMTTCKDTFISDNFNWSLIPINFDSDSINDTDQEVKLLFGKPLCNMVALDVNDKFEFIEVSIMTCIMIRIENLL